MTDEQLMELHNDIRDGITATITVKHLHDLENAIRDILNAFDFSVVDEKQLEALMEAKRLVPADRKPPPPKQDFDPKDYQLKQKEKG